MDLGPAGLVPAAQACGVERWSVKTLGDADAGPVNPEPLASTVPEPAAYPAPSSSCHCLRRSAKPASVAST
jgi:hypothetical protein